MRSKRDTLPDTSLAEARESVDRVTFTELPQSTESVTASRTRLTEAEPWRSTSGDDPWKSSPGDDLPPHAIERLLQLWTELPVEGGDRAVTRAVVDAVASLLPDWQVAARVVPTGGGAPEIVRAVGAGPEGADDALAGERLFEGARYERVVVIEPGGSTLHVAGEDPSCETEGSLSSALLERTARLARRGLELARMQTRATETLAQARSLNAHIAQAEKLASLGQIAAGVVHELNNPLTSIVAYTDYLIRKAGVRPGGPDSDEIDRLRRISESAGRMLRFTRDLVSYARPSSETPVQVSVHLVIDQAIAFCEHVLAGANVTVERRFGEALSPVLGKPEQLAQIFVNLITNACHAMAAGGGRLTVSTEEGPGEIGATGQGAAITITLADTGHGISAEHVPHVFTPFFTTKTSGAGTGLGLAIVKSILDGHGGTIRAASTPGEGATFVITLPVWAR